MEKIFKYWFSLVWGVILFFISGMIKVVAEYLSGGTDIWVSGIATGAKWGFGGFVLIVAAWSLVEWINKPKKPQFDKFGGV